jgi:hypothetical protein
MVDASVVDLDTGAVIENRGCCRPRDSKNKPKDSSLVASSSSASMKRRPGRPLGSKNKPKPSFIVAQDASAAPRNASPPAVKTFSFFVTAGAQCREQQRVPLKFTQFMDGRKLREAILCEKSRGGTPYEVEVYYDGRGEMYFRGGSPQFAEDHELHQGFFMLFDYHFSTSKFDVKIFDYTQC